MAHWIADAHTKADGAVLFWGAEGGCPEHGGDRVMGIENTEGGHCQTLDWAASFRPREKPKKSLCCHGNSTEMPRVE